jgi:hypothetical protein
MSWMANRKGDGPDYELVKGSDGIGGESSNVARAYEDNSSQTKKMVLLGVGAILVLAAVYEFYPNQKASPKPSSVSGGVGGTGTRPPPPPSYANQVPHGQPKSFNQFKKKMEDIGTSVSMSLLKRLRAMDKEPDMLMSRYAKSVEDEEEFRQKKHVQKADPRLMPWKYKQGQLLDKMGKTQAKGLEAWLSNEVKHDKQMSMTDSSHAKEWKDRESLDEDELMEADSSCSA